jgi:hypothetical protein
VPPIISVEHLTKTYASGFHARKNIDLDIRREAFLAEMKHRSQAMDKGRQRVRSPQTAVT